MQYASRNQATAKRVTNRRASPETCAQEESLKQGRPEVEWRKSGPLAGEMQSEKSNKAASRRASLRRLSGKALN